jgi:phage tail sheath protein FI
VYLAADLNTPVEVFTCSRNQSAKNADGSSIFVENVLEASNYLRATNNPAIDGDTPPQDQTVTLAMGGGDDGAAVTDSQMIAAAQEFKNKDNLFLTILMDGGWSTPAFQLELDSICQQRGDCVAILTTPIEKEASASYMTDIIEYRTTDLNLNSNRSALYTPHVQIYDKFNDRNIFAAPDGYAGGAISFSAANFEIWFPPAGARRGVINVLDTRRRFDQAQRDLLQLNGINPIRFTPGRGVLIWGQKTLQSRPSALDRLNVRLLLIVIEPAVEQALEDFLFELNDTATRSLAKAIIDSFMDNILSRRGVTDFRTVIDSTNNTDEDVDNNRMNVDLFIKPTRSVEEINLRVIITRSGVSFDTAATQV